MIRTYHNQADWSKAEQATPEIKQRLDYLRAEIQSERISTEEVAELQALADYIPLGDTQLLEWAGIPEFEED